MTKHDSLWVDDKTAAELCGMAEVKFEKHLPLLEADGFPKPSPWNGKRYRAAILAFWNRDQKVAVLLESASADHHEDDGKDRWGTNDQANRQPRERRASR